MSAKANPKPSKKAESRAKKIKARHPVKFWEFKKRCKPLRKPPEYKPGKPPKILDLPASGLTDDQYAAFIADNGPPTFMANLRYGNAAIGSYAELNVAGQTDDYAWPNNTPVAVEFQADPGGGPDSIVLRVGPTPVTVAPTDSAPYCGYIRHVIIQLSISSTVANASIGWTGMYVTFYDDAETPYPSNVITFSVPSKSTNDYRQVDAPDYITRLTVAGTDTVVGSIKLTWDALNPPVSAPNIMYGRIMVWADPA